jgi:hypothetical protein
VAGLDGYPEPQAFDDAASIAFAMPFGTSRGARC